MARKRNVDDNIRDIDYYDHSGVQRANNPKVGMSRYDKVAEESAKYSYDPHIDPSLQWAGKKEREEFSVPSSSIHIHEVIKPLKLIKNVTKVRPGEDDLRTFNLFAEYDPAERMKKRQADIEFYQHGVDWTNRLIAGDSLVIMNSLIEKENMAGQVQMVYFDPPYGIKYGSNFQPFINKRDVKDRNDGDLNQEPEMLTAFRDTWELGIHSYLTYIRDRLKLAYNMIADTGSIFLQINDTNLHWLRMVCEEVFGSENFVSIITFKKTSPLGSSGLPGVSDYIIWYAKDKKKMKYHKLYIEKGVGVGSKYTYVELKDGTRRNMTKEEKANPAMLPKGSRPYCLGPLVSAGYTPSCMYDIEYQGKIYKCGKKSWRTNAEGMERIKQKGRIAVTGNSISFIMYHDDFNVKEINNMWDDTADTSPMKYAVQTSPKVIQRCILMTTDPGDLVLDITCGGGTTAYTAKQWGRRWITCDTSRIAIDITKQRIMTSVFDYYKLAYKDQGIGSGFVYTKVPHITLKSLAQNVDPDVEILYDQPEIDKTKVRVSGPFTVEAIPSPVVKSLDEISSLSLSESTAKQSDWCEELKATGIIGKNGAKLEFSRVELMEGTKFVQAEAETKEDHPRRAVVCFCNETKTLDSRLVDNVLDEVQTLRPSPQIIVFAAFQFDADAAQMISEIKWPNMTILKVQMNTDLMTEDLKKKRSSDQSFWLVGQPDVELIKDKRTKNRYKVVVHGFDYYDVKTGKITSGSINNIAMWMLDTDYDGLCVEPEQVFFPMGGKKDGWNKLAKTLKAEINEELIDKFAGNESIWFNADEGEKIAVKIIDDRGIESMRVFKAGEE